MRETDASPWELSMIENATQGCLPSGGDFLFVALNAPTAAMDTLDELCVVMGVEPKNAENIADMFAFERADQREEFLRRL